MQLLQLFFQTLYGTVKTDAGGTAGNRSNLSTFSLASIIFVSWTLADALACWTIFIVQCGCPYHCLEQVCSDIVFALEQDSLLFG